MCQFKYDINGSIDDISVRRICDRHSFKVYDSFAEAEEKDVLQLARAMVELYVQEENKRVVDLKSSTSAHRMRKYFQL